MVCNLCPNRCGVDRKIRLGKCKCGDEIKVARAGLHLWEEPVLVGENGSGTVFFSGCTMKCVYCQNYKISDEGFGKTVSEEELCQIFLSLQNQGAQNINLVSPTPYVDKIKKAVSKIKDEIKIPIVYNCGGYETAETVEYVSDFVDIFLPDFKYATEELGKMFSGVKNYPTAALEAIKKMVYFQPAPVLENGVMKKGVIVRHLVLPGHKEESVKALETLKSEIGTDGYLLSLMRQYTPYRYNEKYPELNRRLTSYEYNCVAKAAEEMGFDGFLQEKESAQKIYTPDFDLTGV